MKNAEWMIKNKIDFLRLSCSRNEAVNINQHGYTFNIMLYDKKVSTIYANDASVTNAVLAWLDMEHKEPILDDEEREYLAAVIRPFRDRVEFISKVVMDYQGGYTDCYICIRFTDSSNDMSFPVFCETDMYKGMKLYEKYTLEELGL